MGKLAIAAIAALVTVVSRTAFDARATAGHSDLMSQ